MNTETNYAEHFYAEVNSDIDMLKKNVNENPFSSVAQFLLLYNYKKNNDPSFERYAKQAAIYFNNIPWIQYQLSGVGSDRFSGDKPAGAIQEDVTANESIIQNPVHQTENVTEEKKEVSDFTDHTQTLGTDEIHETIFTANEPITVNSNQESEDVTEEKKEVSDFNDQTQTLGTDEIHETIFTANELITVNSNQQSENVTEEKKEVSDFTDHTQTLGTDEIHETRFTANELITVNSNQQSENVTEEKKEVSDFTDHTQTLGTDEIHETIFTANEQITVNSNQESENVTEEKKEVSDFTDHTQTLGTDEIHETIFTANEQITINSNQESEDEEDLVTFEPLHTVDYFASQGIKIPEEVLENDHLGQQVKSFTAWLKSMKKLHPGQLPEQNEVIEKIIQSSAEVSNQNANVLTEAMAEVLIKQNKRQKAIEMFEKLSLMNPSKSSYFAAKIESLKTV